MNEIVFTPIGLVHSPFKKPKGTPIQAAAFINTEAIIESNKT